MFSTQFSMSAFVAFSAGWAFPEMIHWIFGDPPGLHDSLNWTYLFCALGFLAPVVVRRLRESLPYSILGNATQMAAVCLSYAAGIMAQYPTTMLWPEARSWPRLGVAAIALAAGIGGYVVFEWRKRSARNRRLLQIVASRGPMPPSSRCPVCGWDLDRSSLYVVDDPCCDDCGWILWRLRDWLGKRCKLPLGAVTPFAAIPDGLELDSLDFLGFLTFVEHDFGIAIRSDELGMLKTIGDLIQMIRQRSDRIGFVSDDR